MKIRIASEILRGCSLFKFTVVPDNKPYIENGIHWICRAQDACGVAGVARHYSLFNGWGAPYPETTGYIIPTIFNYARFAGDKKIEDRAVAMAEWLVHIQLECGGIQAGTLTHQDTIPTIFNTGQVLFGWVRAYQETNEPRFLQAIVKASDWLIVMQDDDGAWRRGHSPCVNYRLNTYNTRTAWGLLRAFQVTGNPRYRMGCLKNIRWALRRQKETGWFESNCLTNEVTPLTHTIAYAIRGILEVGISLKEEEFIHAAKKAADPLLAAQRKNGSLAGMYSARWDGAVSWSCLTGNAQMSVVWNRLFAVTGEKKYLDAAKKANDFNKSRVNLSSKNDGIRGALAGSCPTWGPYGKFEYPNWATKFFVDSLMHENIAVDGRNDNRTLVVDG